MSCFLEVLRGKKPGNTPVWFMRQAGRYLPEYREVRSKAKDFLSFCYTPEWATEVTLQPIRRFGFDAAILFSDILVIPHALGVEVAFQEGEGPVLKKLEDENSLQKLSLDRVKEFLSPVYQAARQTISELPAEIPLIGFAGAAWTVACYMLEGKSSRTFETARSVALSGNSFFPKLMDLLVKATIIHLSSQIEAGAKAIQIFDSWAGIVPHAQFEDWVIKPTKKITREINRKYPHIPIIGFPRGTGSRYESYIKYAGVQAVGVDETMQLIDLKDKGAVLQGNLDNVLLKANKEEAVKATRGILKQMNGQPHVFNLGHGILPQTPLENVQAVLDSIRENQA